MKSVSIIVPVHNPATDFEVTINSILNQTYRNTKILLVDDCSTSGAERILKYLVHDNVSVLKTEKNGGGGAARNLGLRHCVSDYIAFCDSDDVWPVDKLARQIDFMERNGFLMSHTDMVSFDAIADVSLELVTSEAIDLEHFLSQTDLYCSTVCIHKSVLGSNTFSEARIRHPFKLWVSILEGGIRSYRVPDIKVSYLKRDGSVSSKPLLTLAYTLFAYVVYPKNKLFALRCLLARMLRASSKNSRIFGGIFNDES